ncbi:hypothetical protein KN815_32495 [Streptomyces sp. 4503]|uniref:Transposase n=1 Tax=Streptomyces niphimycinicus TaxID=2842201 RepID=A0ABS6CNR1_9ACTN|nr:hypothetical protein [Streptomyces niphimycinicus]MBU3868601.1 hypothetical protein [Streptomyces niphimycinicus]
MPTVTARSAATGSWPTKSAPQGSAWRTVWWICRGNRWWRVFGKRRGRIKKADPPVHDDLVQRDSNAAGPSRLRLADITDIPQQKGSCIY